MFELQSSVGADGQRGHLVDGVHGTTDYKGVGHRVQQPIGVR